MSYDNTKLEKAFEVWFQAEIEMGSDFSAYARDLLAAFVSFAVREKMLKKSPGPVVFGRLLAAKDLQKTRREGLTYWHGLRIKETIGPVRAVVPPKTREQLEEAEAGRRVREKTVRQELLSDESREARRRRVKAEMEQENRERVANVEPVD